MGAYGASEDGIDLPTLAAEAGVSERTVRYYIQQGLLPGPGRSGPGAHYRRAHLDRLRLIRRLQERHLPLAEIRRRLEALDDAAVAALLAAPGEAEAPDSAAAYIARVLAQESGRAEAGTPPPHGGGTVPRSRSQWERLELADGVELHVRRPLSRADNRRVEALLKAARSIFGSGR